MKNRHSVLAGSMLLLALSLCGCSSDAASAVPSVPGDLGTVIEKSEIRTEEDIHIRDKNLLYEQQNNQPMSEEQSSFTQGLIESIWEDKV